MNRGISPGHSKFLILFPVVLSVNLFCTSLPAVAQTGVPLPSGMQECAAENGTCTLPAGVTADVYFGAGSYYAVSSGVTGSISCSDTVFGDPYPNVAKACYAFTTLPYAQASWYTTAKVGIFTTYTPGLSTDSAGKTYSLNATANGFNATQYAADVASFGAQYVVFTVWHKGMYPLYPSAVTTQWRPGTNSSTRDVIADLITALAPYNIKLMLYIHASDGQDMDSTDQAATGWNDPTNSYATWNKYVNALIQEVGNRYGTSVAGYWLDEAYSADFQLRVNKAELYTSMKAGNANRILIGNIGPGFNTPSPQYSATDYGAREYYQRPAAITNWQTTANLTTVQASTSCWWACTTASQASLMSGTAAQFLQYTVLQAASNTRGGGVSLAVSPYVGTTSPLWETGVKTTMAAFGTEVVNAGPSLAGTTPSTAYPVAFNTSLPTLPNGIVALTSGDNSKTYIHVLTPPSGKSLKLPPPADQVTFSAGALLSNGDPVAISQTASGVTLTLSSADSWSSLDTVIQLTNTHYQPALYNDTNSSILYQGSSWGYSSNRGAGDYDNDVHYTTNNGDSFSFTFNGVGITYITSESSAYGSANVYLDGNFVKSVSAYTSQSYVPQQTLFSFVGLEPGSHTLQVVKTGGTWMQLDALYVQPALVNDSSSSFTYPSTWGVSSGRGAGDFDDDLHYTTTQGDSFQYAFTGSAIDYIAPTGPQYGTEDIYIDGTKIGSTTAYATSYNPQQLLYSAHGLSNGSHVLKVVMTGGSYLQVDAVRVYTGG